MPRYAYIVLLLNIFLVVRAHSQPLNAASDISARELVDLLDDDFFDTQTSNQRGYYTYYPSDETAYPFGGLIAGASRMHTETPTSLTSSTSTLSSTSHVSKSALTTATAAVTTVAHPTTPTSSSETADATSSISGSMEASPPSTSSSDSKQWKVIGLIVICITFVGVMILTIVFFDTWWSFLCALVCKRRHSRNRGTESMVPDWEKRSWEFKFTDEGGNLGEGNVVSSGGSGIAGVGRGRIDDGKLPNPFDTPRPLLLYAPDRDPHPLEPLERRPSANSLTPCIYR